ncbi:response regulator [soil metagenome]
MKISTEIMHANILVVDDNETNVKLVEYLLEAAGFTAVSSVMDSRKVFDLYLNKRYDLILLDLNMPYLNGFQVMQQLATIETSGYLPVLVVTAEPAHKLRALQEGAMDFISKPFDQTELLTRMRNMIEIRLLQKNLRLNNETLEQRVRDRTAEVRDSHRETILTMTRAAEQKDVDTGHHLQRISFFCQELAAGLGMPDEFCERIFYASPMHDIGKIGIPDAILLKKSGFNPEEWAIMQSHAALGAEILARARSPYLKMGAEIALSHHERWDGSGYPNALAGEAIPVSARIMNICDVYDALRSKRPYKPALTHAVALETIIVGDGRTEPAHFDPWVFAAFQKMHSRFEEIYEAAGE